MYLSIKNDKFNVSEIETNEPEKTFEHENKTTISTEIVDEEKNMSRQMSLFDDISDIEDFPDFIPNRLQLLISEQRLRKISSSTTSNLLKLKTWSKTLYRKSLRRME